MTDASRDLDKVRYSSSPQKPIIPHKIRKKIMAETAVSYYIYKIIVLRSIGDQT